MISTGIQRTAFSITRAREVEEESVLPNPRGPRAPRARNRIEIEGGGERACLAARLEHCQRQYEKLVGQLFGGRGRAMFETRGILTL